MPESASTYLLHGLENPTHISAGSDGSFLLAEGNELVWLQDDEARWEGKVDGQEILGLLATEKGEFLILNPQQILQFSPQNKQLRQIYQGNNLTAFDIDVKNERLVVASTEGYFTLQINASDHAISWQKVLPHLDLTAVAVVDST